MFSTIVLLVIFSSGSALDSQAYLSKYGYLDAESSKNMSQTMFNKRMKEAIKEFQRFSGLPVTGEMDKRTEEMMEMPRCAMRDINNFVLSGRKWDKTLLTYKIDKYPSRPIEFTKQVVDEIIEKAFNFWSQYTDLTFRVDQNQPDIKIGFVQGYHEDLNPFDGPNGVLAHAFYPTDGRVHFDHTEHWTIRTYRGINLLQVAVHEFGHTLGLEHSNVSGAVMMPFYQGYVRNFTLHEDDINAIQKIYGPKRPTINEECPECQSDETDSDLIYMLPSGESLVFRGSLYLKYTTNGQLLKGYPKKIYVGWPGIPNDLDAVYKNASLYYFFKGDKVYAYGKGSVRPGYPKEISSEFPGIPNKIDAALKSQRYTYFFKGCKFWKLDQATQTVSVHSISEIAGVPPNMDSAYVQNGVVIFVKNQLHYELDENSYQINKITSKRKGNEFRTRNFVFKSDL